MEWSQCGVSREQDGGAACVDLDDSFTHQGWPTGSEKRRSKGERKKTKRCSPELADSLGKGSWRLERPKLNFRKMVEPAREIGKNTRKQWFSNVSNIRTALAITRLQTPTLYTFLPSRSGWSLRVCMCSKFPVAADLGTWSGDFILRTSTLQGAVFRGIRNIFVAKVYKHTHVANISRPLQLVTKGLYEKFRVSKGFSSSLGWIPSMGYEHVTQPNLFLRLPI